MSGVSSLEGLPPKGSENEVLQWTPAQWLHFFSTNGVPRHKTASLKNTILRAAASIEVKSAVEFAPLAKEVIARNGDSSVQQQAVGSSSSSSNSVTAAEQNFAVEKRPRHDETTPTLMEWLECSSWVRSACFMPDGPAGVPVASAEASRVSHKVVKFFYREGSSGSDIFVNNEGAAKSSSTPLWEAALAAAAVDKGSPVVDIGKSPEAFATSQVEMVVRDKDMSSRTMPKVLIWKMTKSSLGVKFAVWKWESTNEAQLSERIRIRLDRKAAPKQFRFSTKQKVVMDKAKDPGTFELAVSLHRKMNSTPDHVWEEVFLYTKWMEDAFKFAVHPSIKKSDNPVPTCLRPTRGKVYDHVVDTNQDFIDHIRAGWYIEALMSAEGKSEDPQKVYKSAPQKWAVLRSYYQLRGRYRLSCTQELGLKKIMKDRLKDKIFERRQAPPISLSMIQSIRSRRWRAFFTLSWCCGLRISEMCSVDFTNPKFFFWSGNSWVLDLSFRPRKSNHNRKVNLCCSCGKCGNANAKVQYNGAFCPRNLIRDLVVLRDPAGRVIRSFRPGANRVIRRMTKTHAFGGSSKTHGFRVGHVQHMSFLAQVDKIQRHGRWKALELVDYYNRHNECIQCPKLGKFNCYFSGEVVAQGATEDLSDDELALDQADDQELLFEYEFEGGVGADSEEEA